MPFLGSALIVPKMRPRRVCNRLHRIPSLLMMAKLAPILKTMAQTTDAQNLDAS
jgi:hypothetical protein